LPGVFCLVDVCFLRKGIIKTVAGKSIFETNFKTYAGSFLVSDEYPGLKR
jgi:hypothetical protein